MTRIEFWIAFVGVATLTSCVNLDAKRIENSRSAEFPYNEFVQFLSQEQRDLNWINISGISVNLVKNGAPPALLGRHAKFDSTRSLIVTPECEPPSITLRRNYENSKQFKSYPLGV